MIELLASAGDRGHQSSRPTSASASVSKDGHRFAVGASSNNPRPSSDHPGGAAATAHRRGRLRCLPSRQDAPRRLVQRMTARPRLDGREKPQFGDEALVVRGELTTDA